MNIPAMLDSLRAAWRVIITTSDDGADAVVMLQPRYTDGRVLTYRNVSLVAAIARAWAGEPDDGR